MVDETQGRQMGTEQIAPARVVKDSGDSQRAVWAIYMRDRHGPVVLLTDGAWTDPNNANKPKNFGGQPIVLHRAMTFRTRRLARLHMCVHCDSRAYVAMWKGEQLKP